MPVGAIGTVTDAASACAFATTWVWVTAAPTAPTWNQPLALSPVVRAVRTAARAVRGMPPTPATRTRCTVDFTVVEAARAPSAGTNTRPDLLVDQKPRTVTVTPEATPDVRTSTAPLAGSRTVAVFAIDSPFDENAWVTAARFTTPCGVTLTLPAAAGLPTRTSRTAAVAPPGTPARPATRTVVALFAATAPEKSDPGVTAV